MAATLPTIDAPAPSSAATVQGRARPWSTLTGGRARHRPSGRARRERRVGYAMLAPMVLVVGGLIGYPLVLSIWFGFTDKAIGEAGTWIGLGNYVDSWNDPIFRRTLWNTFNYTVTAVLAKLLIGVAMA
ncbi:MAG: hypothetical protein AAF547_23750, partial [Actinomycetota bacterium]